MPSDFGHQVRVVTSALVKSIVRIFFKFITEVKPSASRHIERGRERVGGRNGGTDGGKEGRKFQKQKIFYKKLQHTS